MLSALCWGCVSFVAVMVGFVLFWRLLLGEGEN